jgi:hypothetical protein
MIGLYEYDVLYATIFTLISESTYTYQIRRWKSHVLVFWSHRHPEHGGNMFTSMWVPTHQPSGADYDMNVIAE